MKYCTKKPQIITMGPFRLLCKIMRYRICFKFAKIKRKIYTVVITSDCLFKKLCQYVFVNIEINDLDITYSSLFRQSNQIGRASVGAEWCGTCRSRRST